MLQSGQPIITELRVSFSFSLARLHLGQELLVGERDAVAEVDEHVGHRAVARALPVARIRHVLVLRRVVHVADDVQHGALGQQRRVVVVVVVAAHPVVVVADAVDASRVL